MSIPKGVGTCRHLELSARVGTFSGVGTFVVLTQVHMTDITGVGTCRYLKVSAPRVVGTFEVLTHVSTSQLPNNFHMSARVGTPKCRHRCRHLSTCRHIGADILTVTFTRCLGSHPSGVARQKRHSKLGL